MKEWYSPGAIRFRRNEIIWLLSHYQELAEGSWPKEPKNTGYTDTPLRARRYRREAYFCTPAEFKAELDVRMALIGEDSSILRDIYIIGMTHEKAAEMRRISESTLYRRLNRAMKQMVGWKRRREE